MLGRVDVEADHIAHLVDEGWIARDLEALDQMRLQSVLAPDLLDTGLAQADHARQRTRTPVRRLGRCLAQGGFNDRSDLIGQDGRGPTGARFVA